VTCAHTSPECVGRWRARRDPGGDLWWRCDGCRARLPHSDEVANALLAENRLGLLLRDLTRHGGRILRQGDTSAG